MIDLNIIYNEDCLITMSNIPNDSIDVIITSPPYNKAGLRGYIQKTHRNDTWKKGRNFEYDGDALNDFMNENDYQDWQVKILNEFHRIIKPDGSIFYNHKVRIKNHKAYHPLEFILKSNLNLRQQIIWNRNSSPAVDSIRFLPTTELIFWLTKSNTQPNFKRVIHSLFQGEVWNINAKPNADHPAPFPIEIPKTILQNIPNTNKDLIVYDPFAGTGTTLKVAKILNFNYIGSEKSETYCKYALNQLKDEIDLFVK